VGSCEIFYEEDKMNEYTLISIIFVIFTIAIDFILKTRLIVNKKFLVFWVIMFILIFVINGYLTWRPIVIYGESFYMGIRLFTIPVEDFLFGFSLISLNIIIWEYYSDKPRTRQREAEE
jgi:lycopene cyclase domain-containing protein